MNERKPDQSGSPSLCESEMRRRDQLSRKVKKRERKFLEDQKITPRSTALASQRGRRVGVLEGFTRLKKVRGD